MDRGDKQSVAIIIRAGLVGEEADVTALRGDNDCDLEDDTTGLLAGLLEPSSRIP
jgi:hypothetical protein